MFKKLLSIFVLLTIVVGSAWGENRTWDFTQWNTNQAQINQISGWSSQSNSESKRDFSNAASSGISEANSLLFGGGQVRVNATSNGYFRLFSGNQNSGAYVLIPVTKAQNVTIYAKSSSNQAAPCIISSLNNSYNEVHTQNSSFKELSYVTYKARENGFVKLMVCQNYRGSSNAWEDRQLEIKSIKVEDAVYFEKNGNIVTSDEAEFIGLNYEEPKLMGTQTGDDITYEIVPVQGGRIASFLDPTINDIMFINCGVCDVYATVKRNGQQIAQEQYRLTIKADNATYDVNKYTYTLTGNGKLLENVVRGQVPQITMSFGNPDANNATMVRYNDLGNGQFGSTPVATVLDEDGWRQVVMTDEPQNNYVRQKPDQGSFYAFTPETDGYLTVKGFFNRTNNNAYIVKASDLAPARKNSTEYLTSLVDKTWGGAPAVLPGVAPSVTTADGDVVPLREKYSWDRIFDREIQMSQTVSGLENGTYRVNVYAFARLTEGRNIKGRGNFSNTNATVSENEVDWGPAAIGCQCNWDTNNFPFLGWLKPKSGKSISEGEIQGGLIHVDNVKVTNGTIKIDFLTQTCGDGARGVNWISMQIQSIERVDVPPVPTWTPYVTIDAPSSSSQEVETPNVFLEKGETYYLYGNTPQTNGGEGWVTYQLHSFTFIPGISFAEWSHVLGENETSYTQKVQKWEHITGVTYSGVGRGGLTATVNSTTGEVSNFVGDGGAIIVTASKTMDDHSIESDFYVITKPYKTHKWTFANMNYTEDGKEDLVCSDLLLDGSLDWAVNYKVRNYNQTTGNLYYINVPVMTNNTALHGENAAYIGTTAGLLVEANSKCFGSNATVSNLLDGLTAEQKNDAAIVDAKLRQMLLYTKNDVQHDASGHYTTNKITFQKGAKIIIPALKAGQYVRVKWARYYGKDETNQHQGEFIQVTNLDDAEGNPFTRNIRSWSPQNVNKGENEYGYYVFKVHDNGPVSFEPQDDGWTNIYSIEVADEFEKIDYIVSGQVPSGKVMTDTDLRLSDIENVEDNKFKKAPTSFTHKYGESATHQFANQYTSSTEGLVNNPSVGSRSQYGLIVKYSLEGLDGTPTLMPSLTANVNSGNGNGVKGRRNANGTSTATSITEDGLLTMAGQGQCVVVQKAYEGEYVFDIQRTVITITQDVDITWDYPYTWDFTNISTRTLTDIGANNNGTGNANWQKNTDGSFKATDSFKNTFVQGGMLSSTGTYENLSTDEQADSETGNRISEYAGLGFQTETNAASSATGLDYIGITVPTDKPGEHGGAGGMVIGNKETTVVVPDVPAGMTVYVRVEPQENASVNVGGNTQKDFSDDSEDVYSTTTSEDGNVELKLQNVVVKGIAVSDLKKTCYFPQGDTHVYYNTDSHALPIDYTLTKYYTKNEILAYEVNSITEKNVTLGLVEKGPANTGYVVSTVYTDDNTVQRPLFVPCANDIKNNMTEISAYSKATLLPHVEAGAIEGGASNRDHVHYDYYVLTNIYYQINQETDEFVGDSKTASVPGFYRVVKGDNSSLNRYRAYLKLPKPTNSSGVKSIPLFDFDGELVDAIDVVPAVATDGIDVNGTFYTLQGMKIQGLPKQGGVYIQNGKKVMVK